MRDVGCCARRSGRRQAVLQDLARRRRRQGVEHDDFARPLVGRQMAAGVRRQLLDGGGAARQQLHIGHDLLVGMDGAADDRRLDDRRVGVQDRFDLGRIDVEARTDDQLLGAPGDEQRLAFEAREVAGVEPAVAVDGRGSRVRRAVVAAHDVGAAHMQLADLAVWHRRPVAAHQAHLDAGQDRADRAVRARCVGADAGNARCAFGDAVAIEQRLAELLFDHGLQRRIERRAGDVEAAQPSARQRIEAARGLVFEQPLVGRGHAEEQRYAVVADGFHESSRIVLRHDMDGAAADQSSRQDDGEADDVRHRQHAVDHVLRRGLAQHLRNVCVEQDVAVREHHALGVAGRARGVEQGRHLAGAVLLDRLRLGALVRRAHGHRAEPTHVHVWASWRRA